MDSYQLVDCGDGSKLESLGGYVVTRQASQAFWPPGKKPWPAADAVHHRSTKGGGHWEFNKSMPSETAIAWGDLTFKIKLTEFGHIGLFPEQQDNWSWIRERVTQGYKDVLNLFGYTGGSSLAAASAGGHVTHVDASKGVVSWARENADLNDLSKAPIRWLIDDVLKFVAREQRRGSLYDAVVLDPPSYGRGNRGETFRIEQDLVPLLESLKTILRPRHFVCLSCHTPGFSPQVMTRLAKMMDGIADNQIEAGEMLVPESNSRLALPSGAFARWTTR